MYFRFKMLVFASLFTVLAAGAHAQDIDALKHRKFYDICSIKKDCEHCSGCDHQRFITKIYNKESKKIRSVYYKFYSPVFNSVLEKEAKLMGDKIDPKQAGQFYVCVFDVRHWFVSRIVYNDGSSVAFSLKGRLGQHIQEADECECND